MSPDVLEQLIPIIAVVFGISGTCFLAAICFPSTRAAIAERLRGKSGAAVAEVSAAVAEVRALRSEIYALRSELAAVSRALPSAGSPPGGRLGQGV